MFENLKTKQQDIIATSFGPESAQRALAMNLLKEEEARLKTMGAFVYNTALLFSR